MTPHQKSILFYSLLVPFCVITALSIWGVFFELKNFDKEYKTPLFSLLILEIVGVTLGLFKSGFLGAGNASLSKKIWIDLGDDDDVRKYIGKDIAISPRGDDGSPLCDEMTNCIQNDRGLYVTPELPTETVSVMVTLESGDTVLEGSFSAQSYTVKLEGQPE